MEWQWAMLIIFGSLFILMLLGLPVAFSILSSASIGAYIWWGGDIGLKQLTICLYESLNRFTFLPIPLFALMGELLFHSQIAGKMIETMDKWLGRIPGRLGLLAVFGGALMSTLTGVGSATIAVLGSELVPEMQKRGYNKTMSLGPILGSSGLAVMIPPSGLAVMLAAVGRISVGDLLIAIIVPGIIMAFLYSFYIILRCYLNPSIAPPYTVPATKLSVLIIETVMYVLPVGLVIFLVTGIIFLGVATPSESAATGVVGVLILVTCYGKLKWKVIKNGFIGTAKITGMIFLVIAAVSGFGQVLSFSGVTGGLLELVTSLQIEPIWVVCVMIGMFIIVGMFIPVISMVLVMMPIMLPIITTFEYSPVWFATCLMLALEMSVVSPPYGTDLFIMKLVAPSGTSMKDVYKASTPFVCCDAIVLILLIFIPGIALWLPSMMIR